MESTEGGYYINDDGYIDFQVGYSEEDMEAYESDPDGYIESHSDFIDGSDIEDSDEE